MAYARQSLSLATPTPPDLSETQMSNSPYPILLTPGPLTTSARTKEAMLRDWGSWDADFNQITARLREQIVRIVHGEATHVCVPLQGSGTFSVEAAIGTIVPRDGHVLVPSNGAYCQRIARICKYLGRRHTVIDYTEDRQVLAADVDLALTADPSITHVALVHCETGAGVLNPLDEIAQVVARHGKGLIVDAMSSFGAIEIGARYARNCKALISGLARIGLRAYLDPAIQAPIIVTFHAPADPGYDFKTFYNEVKKHGYLLYPGKLTTAETFRVGCIGHFGDAGIPGAVRAIEETLAAMGIRTQALPA